MKREIKQKFKILIKILLATLLFFILIFNRQIPAFIYNEYEFIARANYQLTEMVFDKTETMIDMRTGNSKTLVTDQKKAQLYQPINQTIEVIIESVDRQKMYINKQNKLLKLLPLKYQKYHQFKLEYFQDYSDAFYAYQNVKLAEHWLYTTMVQLNKAENSLLEIDFSSEGYFEKLSEVNTIATLINQEVDKAQAKNWLTEDLSKYITMKSNKIILLYDIFKNPNFDDKSYTSGMKSIQHIESKIPNFNQAFSQWHEKLIDPQFNLGREKYNSAIEKLTIANHFYISQKLNRDWITIILSKFSHHYPKNY